MLSFSHQFTELAENISVLNQSLRECTRLMWLNSKIVFSIFELYLSFSCGGDIDLLQIMSKLIPVDQHMAIHNHGLTVLIPIQYRAYKGDEYSECLQEAILVDGAI